MESGSAQNSPSGPVWKSSRELGSGGPGLASIGQGPVAILAGFDLATVVLLTTGNGRGGVLQAALACFGVSAALFILAMAFITAAEDYSATPGDRMMYYPEAKVSAEKLEEQRRLQRQDEAILSLYFNYRVVPTVTLAVLGTLAGLALVAVAKGWSPGPDVAMGGASVVGLIYIADVLGAGRNWWLFPRPLLGSQKRPLLGAQGRPILVAERRETRFWPVRMAARIRSAQEARRERRFRIVDIYYVHVPPMTRDGHRAMFGAGASARPDGSKDT